MSTLDSDGPASAGTGSAFNSRPWVGVAVPLAVVFGLGVLGVAVTVLRRRNRAARRGLRLNSQGRRALERDLEGYGGGGGIGGPAYAAGPPGDAWGATGGNGGGRRAARTANRWAWANNLSLGRREEGLNELGEAPPPYDGPPEGAAHKEENVELRDLGGERPSGSRDADADADAARPPPPPPVVAGALPPGYAEITTGRTPSSTGAINAIHPPPPPIEPLLARPPPAALPPERVDGPRA